MRRSLPRQSTGSSDLRFSTPQRMLQSGQFSIPFCLYSSKVTEPDLGHTLVVLVTSVSGLGSGFLGVYLYIVA